VQNRLVLYVSLCLLVVALFAGAVIGRVTYLQSVTDAATLERQLVRTVLAQAEVAAFAANAEIADGVIEGLRANPTIIGARLVGIGSRQFQVSAGLSVGDVDIPVTEYALFSPIDGRERIGTLAVGRNEPFVEAQAKLSAVRQISLLFIQIALTAVLIFLFSRSMIGRPLGALATALAAIRPGSGARVSVAEVDRHNEIGSLAASANQLLDATENLLAVLEERATTDALTGLPNRRAFMARLEDDLQRVRRYDTESICVLMCDLDHFKQINDRYGHAGGDTVLRAFADLLRREVRKADLAGRVGGEEFAMTLGGGDTDNAMQFAERLRQHVADCSVDFEGLDLHFSISIGVTRMLPSDTGPDDALARADAALYRAKHLGRNRVERAG
jgi:diguanylate cyclase (GGDEF)-like protein